MVANMMLMMASSIIARQRDYEQEETERVEQERHEQRIEFKRREVDAVFEDMRKSNERISQNIRWIYQNGGTV